MDIPSRKNGLERPFHPFQVSSWILQLFNILSFYCTTVPCLPSASQIPTTIIFTCLQLMILILGYKLSKSDPTDEIVELFHKTTDKILALQLEEKHEKFCNFCRSPVNSSSKHCVRCNRCTKNFDHHCKWVNNCIGNQNYKNFIYLISTCMCIEGFFLILCMYIILLSVHSPNEINQNIKEYYNLNFFTFFVTVQGILALEGAVFSVLLGYLIILHMYLGCKGITTYEFILKKRQENRITPNSKIEQDNKALELNQAQNLSASGLEYKISSRI